jgi:hypothetical protein
MYRAIETIGGRAGMKARSEANSKVAQMILPKKELCA